MKYRKNKKSKKKSNQRRFGRIRPFLLAMLIIISGILMDRWWWQIGVIMLVALFVGGYYRYRSPY